MRSFIAVAFALLTLALATRAASANRNNTYCEATPVSPIAGQQFTLLCEHLPPGSQDFVSIDWADGANTTSQVVTANQGGDVTLTLTAGVVGPAQGWVYKVHNQTIVGYISLTVQGGP